MTGLDMQQLEALKHGFEGFDKEGTGIINSTQSQMIFKMMGVQVQVNGPNGFKFPRIKPIHWSVL